MPPRKPAGTIPRRILGKTGVSVPILGFGTASCGIRRSVANGADLYREAIRLGVNYFDTAPKETGYGRAQEQLGHVLKERRNDLFVATKCHEARGDDARRSLDRSLKELRTDHADLVYVHSLGDLDLRTVMSKDGVLAALAKARRDGRLRYIGVSGHHRPAMFLPLIKEFDIDVIMCAVNFADRYTYSFEQRVWPAAARKRIALVAMKVFGGADWKSKAMSNAMIAREYQARALRYSLSEPHVSLAVVGMATSEELQANVAAVKRFTPLTAAERQALAPVGKKLAARWGAHFGPLG